MKRIIFAFLCSLFLASTVHAEKVFSDISYKDWRLERPFIYGFTVGLSLGYLELKPSWRKAKAMEVSSIPSGMVRYIERHMRFSLFSGVVFGYLCWLFVLGTLVYRFSLTRKPIDLPG